jgi:hypothetical protein
MVIANYIAHLAEDELQLGVDGQNVEYRLRCFVVDPAWLSLSAGDSYLESCHRDKVAQEL